MKNKIQLFSIVILSVLLTSFGVYMDDDKNNLSTIGSIKEFILMSILVFTIISIIFYSTKIISKKLSN